jgi:hypothetical protein
MVMGGAGSPTPSFWAKADVVTRARAQQMIRRDFFIEFSTHKDAGIAISVRRTVKVV